MRTIAMLFALVVTMLLPMDWAVAGADHRTALDRKHKAVREWQEDLKQRFKDADRDANRLKGIQKTGVGSSGKATKQTGAGSR